ncbi:hypothetical protein V5E97_11160 [Singulisphaera sp. Ch08]|uniref:Uncharacterized protein n=1 Tax=Singulisphaera sp. Ch08 TaxID=3120278 RepID=A0AAU7CN76_9BACT
MAVPITRRSFVMTSVLAGVAACANRAFGSYFDYSFTHGGITDNDLVLFQSAMGYAKRLTNMDIINNYIG